MYLALYRKWRPTTFDDVISQEHITTTLRNEVKNGRTAHAYLFTGSRGTGKTTCAKILAKAVNCLHPVDGNPCMECEICKGIDDGSILDVLEIDAASNNGVDDVRILREEANYTPAQCKYRVYIIDETHMLSVSAFNALLKIMEEPPPHVKFILATTEVHKVPATVLSRCQRFDFSRIRTEDIAKRLLYIADHEAFTLEPDAAYLIARLADGGMRDALSTLDQCIAYADHVDTAIVSQATGIVQRDYLFDMAQFINLRQASEVLRCINALYDSSKDLQKLVAELIEHFRNLMLVKTVPDCQNLVRVLPEELERLKEQAQGVSLVTILRSIGVFQECLDQVSRGYEKRLSVEMAVIRLCSPDLDVSLDALLERLERLEQVVNTGRLLSVSQEQTVVSKPEHEVEAEHSESAEKLSHQQERKSGGQASAPQPEKTSVQTETPQMLAIWPEVLGFLQEHDPALAGILSGSIAYVSGDNLFIDSPNTLFSQMIKRDNFLKTLLQTLEDRTGIRYRPRIRKKRQGVAKETTPLDEISRAAQAMGIEVNEQS